MAASAPSPTVIRFGVFELDRRSGELRRRGVRLRIQRQPLDVLAILLEARGEPVSRENLRAALWPDGTHVDFDRSMNRAMAKLREALGDDASSPRFIETLPRIGYRFIGPVESASPETDVRPHRSRVPRRALAIAVVVAVAAFVTFRTFRHTPSEGDATPLRSIAVLPFENLSGDPSQDFFSDGLTDELITELAQLDSIRVVSRTSVMRFRESRRPLSEIARQLRVEAVVEGSVVRREGRARVSVQLVRAKDDRQLWARNFESDARDVVTLEGELASAVAHRIGARIAPETEKRIRRGSPSDPRAFDLYLRARRLFYSRQPDDELRAAELLAEALRLDPSYAEAYAVRSECYTFLSYEGALPPAEGYSRARADAKEALKIDANLGEAHAALGALLFDADWNFAASESELRRAIGLEPGNVTAHQWLARDLLVVGRGEAALAESRAAEELDPLSFTARNVVGTVLYGLRRYEAAADEFREAARLAPNWSGTRWLLGRVLWTDRRHREALEAYREGARLMGNGRLESAMADLGRVLEARGSAAVVREILKLDRIEPIFASPALRARWLAEIGDRDAAFHLLDRAVEIRDWRVIELKATPEFDPLRSDPRYSDLLRRIGLPAV